MMGFSKEAEEIRSWILIENGHQHVLYLHIYTQHQAFSERERKREREREREGEKDGSKEGQ